MKCRNLFPIVGFGLMLLLISYSKTDAHDSYESEIIETTSSSLVNITTPISLDVMNSEVSEPVAPEYHIEIVYPTDIEDTFIPDEYLPYIYQAADEYDICPELIMAMIEKESSGKADISSPNGSCKGLMQICEKYHIERMNKLGVTDLHDPEGNIWVGVDYLYELIEKYEDVSVALMVYNGDKNAFEDGYLSKYASKILERSSELEALHYGVPVISYDAD